MDPTQTLFDILDDLSRETARMPGTPAEHREEIEENLSALLTWVKGGGFLPTVEKLGLSGFRVDPAPIAGRAGWKKARKI